MSEPLSYLFPITTQGTYTAAYNGPPRVRPTGDLKVVWSCANCGHELHTDVVERNEYYYEVEVPDEWACPVCDAAYYLERER